MNPMANYQSCKLALSLALFGDQQRQGQTYSSDYLLIDH